MRRKAASRRPASAALPGWPNRRALASLQVEKASVEGQRALVEADLGPVKYLATLLGADNETVLRWFILVVACMLDPAAVLLLLAAVSARRR